MYRAVALAAMRCGHAWDRPGELVVVARNLKIQVTEDRILLDGEDVTEAVRSSEVTALTRFAADNPGVRQLLVQLQREVADGRDIVTEGRDQGTVAFPDAECKIFLTASPQQRALRRLQDLAAQGETTTLDEVLADISRRDKQDASRPVGALVAAPDAIEVFTDGMTVEQVVDCLAAVVRECQNSQNRGEPEASASE